MRSGASIEGSLLVYLAAAISALGGMRLGMSNDMLRPPLLQNCTMAKIVPAYHFLAGQTFAD